MEVNILGHDEQGCGVEVFDENGHRHSIAIDWDGSIHKHSTQDYPLKREDRTEDEQRIMSQVEERARYEAQQEFPDADILDPMWDPDHVEAGIQALSNYPLANFRSEFRDFYEALRDPAQFVDDPDMDPETPVVTKRFRFRDGDVLDVDDLLVGYDRHDGTSGNVGTVPDYPDDEKIICAMPPLDFEDHITFDDHFHDIVVNHLMAQIRDIYLNMGEQPPREYRVQGIGKLDIIGDGIGET